MFKKHIMRNPLSILSSILLVTIFNNCASSQFDKKPPFTVQKAEYNKVIGDLPNSKTTIVTITFTEQIDPNIKFDSIYFNNKATEAKVTLIENKTTLSGNFNTQDRLIVLDKDPKKEFGNKPILKTNNLPFKLTNKDCVVGYFLNNKKFYYKINSLKEK